MVSAAHAWASNSLCTLTDLGAKRGCCGGWPRGSRSGVRGRICPGSLVMPFVPLLLYAGVPGEKPDGVRHKHAHIDIHLGRARLAPLRSRRRLLRGTCFAHHILLILRELTRAPTDTYGLRFTCTHSPSKHTSIRFQNMQAAIVEPMTLAAPHANRCTLYPRGLGGHTLSEGTFNA